MSTAALQEEFKSTDDYAYALADWLAEKSYDFEDSTTFEAAFERWLEEWA